MKKPRVFLKEEQVREIKKSFGTMTIKEIAFKYNVSVGCIEMIKYGCTWTHVVLEEDHGKKEHEGDR